MELVYISGVATLALEATKCNGCQECVLHCPDFAVQVTRRSGGREE